MRSARTISILFTDIVGSTDLLGRLGDVRWDAARRSHFTSLRELLAEHSGTEVKNTGDGLMASFHSTSDAVACALAMQRRVRLDASTGADVAIRIGLSTGEAFSEGGDWFGTPVVEAARLCALAEPGAVWATAIVRVLAGSTTSATFHDVGPTAVKGFEHPVDVVGVRPGAGAGTSFFTSVDDHQHASDRLMGQLDFWESLPSIQQVRSTMLTALAPIAGDRVCDIGCGTGTELIRLARIVGTAGRAVGVEASQIMCDETARRAAEVGVDVETIRADGRDTGLASGEFDSVRIERVIQHVGDVAGFLREAVRIVRPGGRIVVADSDWGSLMIHPGDRSLINRFTSGIENSVLAEPWAGRKLYEAMLDAGMVDVSNRIHVVSAGPGIRESLDALLERRVAAGVGTQAELETFNHDLSEAFERGSGVYSFCMFVVWGRTPDV